MLIATGEIIKKLFETQCRCSFVHSMQFVEPETLLVQRPESQQCSKHQYSSQYKVRRFCKRKAFFTPDSYKICDDIGIFPFWLFC